LAYSIILLNTDAHNPQIKNRMTKADFIKNNRGINDNADLPEELLTSIFDEITSNEIRMKDEVEANVSVPTQGPGIAAALANVGRDLQKEAFVIQSLGMANKTEVSEIEVKGDVYVLIMAIGVVPNIDALPTQRIQGC
jgi:brefeldin A-inhibited guanine nucleotide-exchange protein